MPESSPSINAAALAWSVIILIERACSLFGFSMPASSFILFITGANVSISYTVFLPCNIAAVLSRPIPVSTFCCFSFSYFPSPVLLYCIKTSFQTSKYFPQKQPGLQSFEQGSFPVSTNISVSGPQGPVFPAGPHQLSFFGKKKILSLGIPDDCHTLADSSSLGTLTEF